MKQKKPFILLIVIYLAFISLGLPDGILGVAWPSIRDELAMPLESMGILTTSLLIMSAVSSFVSGRVLQKWGTGAVTFFSGLMTGCALLGYSLAPSFLWLLLCTVPLGFGQGAVDSGLNLFVAAHYSARHMNWLHCFWGIGASAGPMVMTFALLSLNWRSGYGIVSCVQLILSTVLLFSLLSGLWRVDFSLPGAPAAARRRSAGLHSLPDQALAVLLFFLYSGIEFSMGLWLNSVLVESRNVPVSLAGLSVTAYYASIMAGRFLSGIVVNRMGNLRMIRLGLLLAVGGAVCVWTLPGTWTILAGTVMIGLGLAPIYPCLMHETPDRFSKEVNEKLIGYQVGAACLGGSIIASGTGVLLSHNLELLFPIVIVLLAAAFSGNELLTHKAQKPVPEERPQ